MPVFSASDGAQLFYRDDGEGAPLLCLAGLTRNSRDFDYLAPHLPPLRLIRLDYRGRGRSAWTGPQTYTIAQEAADVLALLDHLGLAQVAILGTSRGGLIGMLLALVAHDRLRGLCLNDIGPVIEPDGLQRIAGYIGTPPAVRTHEEAAELLARAMPEFTDLPDGRWREEARRHFTDTDQGLQITYDPALRVAFLQALEAGLDDLWPMFDACAGLPLALLRGAGSSLLSRATCTEMQRRRPDMHFAEVPGRGHVPFLDEPQSLHVIRAWWADCRQTDTAT
ncbi:MAG: alpha/beta fold hydrolase [Roseinatronobacter sp.]